MKNVKCEDIEKCLERLQFYDRSAIATSRMFVKTLSFQNKIHCFDSDQSISTFPVEKSCYAKILALKANSKKYSREFMR